MPGPVPRKLFARQRIQYKLYTERRALIAVLRHFNALQMARDIEGAVGEIGVADGLFFIPLAQCRRPGERAAAIDIFEDIDRNWNTGGGISSIDMLQSRIVIMLGNDTGVAYIKGDSLEMTAADLLARTGGQRFRLFSIDGAHSVQHTRSDLNLAAETAAPGAVVFLDDIRNWGWPGVLDGLARYMLQQSDHKLVPFFLFQDKLLLTTPDSHASCLEAAVEVAAKVAKPTDVCRVSDFFGHRVVGY
jgi:hypothetical protein